MHTRSSGLVLRRWVNYFLHSGHLHIEGLKMSKSLKNFIKICDAVERFGARQLRLVFLLQRYNAPMNYSEKVSLEGLCTGHRGNGLHPPPTPINDATRAQAMEHIAGVEKSFVEFFANAKAKLRALQAEAPQRWGEADHAFHGTLASVKDRVARALADDFDTPGAMSALQVRSTMRATLWHRPCRYECAFRGSPP